jgi:hypothetical protein
MQPAESLDTVAHVIQLALTPVFLLSGLATLLSAFATRLGRVADRVDQLSADAETVEPAKARHLAAQLQRLILRSLVLDLAVVIASIGGMATCAATLVLFIGALRDSAAGWMLFLLFGFAVLCTIGALAAFVVEMLLAGSGLRGDAAQGKRLAREG